MSEQWINLEQATAITGVSQAIILDTTAKYQTTTDSPITKTEHGIVYFNKRQLVSLFPNSANPLVKDKIPGTVFRWFDDLRRAYETSLNTMFKRVEKVKDDHKDDIERQYQARMQDMQAQYQAQLNAIEKGHDAEIKALNHHLEKLENDSVFYQKQILTQQETLAQLNNRYDAVILALRDKESQTISSELAKDITPTPLAIPSNDECHDDEEESATKEQQRVDFEEIVNQAYQARNENNYELAVELFQQAALSGHAKAMGALGRAYFVGEGIEKNIELAVAWLHLAATNGFEPAGKKLEALINKVPEQYQHGLKLAEPISLQIKLNKDALDTAS
ncbi:sel1 repeat family protein [Catenovulum sp. SM1970]|uniref:tetratricopeptide repeat protein n=1 Tax=Marinifaba aquimaris TaxID=2741323 RepID=UPI001573B0BC|nr:SEL1-like repeat protein [Marinifaba aquimaris]NTS77968.1 sel1 repeat family protein [Marinifaba aquimaris]